MKIRDVMTTEVVSVTLDTSYADAAKFMHSHTLATVPIMGTDGSLVGILSEKDLFRALYPKYDEFYETSGETAINEEQYEDRIDELRAQPVSNFMTKNVLTISSLDPIMKAGGLMLARHIHLLPVVDDGKLVGIVSRENVFSAILKSRLGF